MDVGITRIKIIDIFWGRILQRIIKCGRNLQF